VRRRAAYDRGDGDHERDPLSGVVRSKQAAVNVDSYMNTRGRCPTWSDVRPAARDRPLGTLRIRGDADYATPAECACARAPYDAACGGNKKNGDHRLISRLSRTCVRGGEAALGCVLSVRPSRVGRSVNRVAPGAACLVNWSCRKEQGFPQTSQRLAIVR
jgi:hypothetical protein